MLQQTVVARTAMIVVVALTLVACPQIDDGADRVTCECMCHDILGSGTAGIEYHSWCTNASTANCNDICEASNSNCSGGTEANVDLGVCTAATGVTSGRLMSIDANSAMEGTLVPEESFWHITYNGDNWAPEPTSGRVRFQIPNGPNTEGPVQIPHLELYVQDASGAGYEVVEMHAASDQIYSGTISSTNIVEIPGPASLAGWGQVEGEHVWDQFFSQDGITGEMIWAGAATRFVVDGAFEGDTGVVVSFHLVFAFGSARPPIPDITVDYGSDGSVQVDASGSTDPNEESLLFHWWLWSGSYWFPFLGDFPQVLELSPGEAEEFRRVRVVMFDESGQYTLEDICLDPSGCDE
jgi:hypothetical protein